MSHKLEEFVSDPCKSKFILSPIKFKALIIKDGADFIHSVQNKYLLLNTFFKKS